MAEPKPSIEETSGEKAVDVALAKVEQKAGKDYYFDSYAHFGIHEEMLKDTVRTGTYMASFLRNKHLIRGKVVLDVGCGTGILSLFAAKAGAKLAIGIECSDIADKAMEIVKQNGYEGKVVILKGKVEEVELPVKKVDIIVSEWMGYFLMYESMVDTVLFARDKWLKPDGLLFPDVFQLFLYGIEDAEYKKEKIGFWDNVEGFDLSPIKEIAMSEPLVDTVDPRAIVTNEAMVLRMNLHDIRKGELTFSVPFTLRCYRNDTIHAFVSHFDCEFSPCHCPVGFSTGPSAPYTHWQQSIFYLREPLEVREGEEVQGKLTFGPNKGNPRDLDINFEFTTSLQDTHRNYSYRMR